MTPVEEYIYKLQSLKAGAQALLRASAGTDLDESVTAFDLFAGVWWPLRQKTAAAPRRSVSWLVARVHAQYPMRFVPRLSLPVQLRRCTARLDLDARRRLEERLDALLRADLESIEPHLCWALAYLRDNGINELDWQELTNTLSRWELPSFRRKWADGYLGTASTKGETDDENPDSHASEPQPR